MRSRLHTTRREILAFWKMLVVDGVWPVDTQSVTRRMEYFDDVKDSRELISLQGKEANVELRAGWDVAPAF